MQLTKFSDYALRVLMYAHAAGDRRVTIEEMAAAYRISRAHLMKVVNSLTRAGYLTAHRGRSGGASARWCGRLSPPLRSSNAFRPTINAWSPAVAGWRACSTKR
jgi:Rrf2 family transcriptional regulator, nitric oxide-sensitive transcriptional repressor